MAKINITLDPDFARELDKLGDRLERWSQEGEKELFQAMRQIGQRHRAEAVKRVPVDKGTLKKNILTNTDQRGDTIRTETGTNIEYGKYLEFGTDYIAGGRVKALGDDPIISDAEAIKHWPAKDKDGLAGNRERMPWLRTAWASMRTWAIKQIIDSLKPPPR